MMGGGIGATMAGGMRVIGVPAASTPAHGMAGCMGMAGMADIAAGTTDKRRGNHGGVLSFYP
jgi:hypothetical protein